MDSLTQHLRVAVQRGLAKWTGFVPQKSSPSDLQSLFVLLLPLTMLFLSCSGENIRGGWAYRNSSSLSRVWV
jgi:hypothetical protein